MNEYTNGIENPAAIKAEGGFNTGRLYAAEGQPIYWTQYADGWLHFTDRARHVSGWIMRNCTKGELSAPILPGWLMNAYDRNKYELTGPRDADGYRRAPARPAADFDFGPALRI